MSRRSRGNRPPVIGGGGGGGIDEVTTWTMVTESQWSTTNDPGAHLTSSTKTSGTLSYVVKNTINSIFDGWGEDIANNEVMLTTLYPDFSDTTDRFEWCFEIAAMPLNANKWGFGVYMIDSATYATANGAGFMVYPNSTTVANGAQMGATGAAVTAATCATNTNVPLQVYGSMDWDSGGVCRQVYRVKRTSDQIQGTILSSPSTAMGAVANRRLRVGCVHLGTGGANTISGRLYTRRIRGSGFFV